MLAKATTKRSLESFSDTTHYFIHNFQFTFFSCTSIFIYFVVAFWLFDYAALVEVTMTVQCCDYDQSRRVVIMVIISTSDWSNHSLPAGPNPWGPVWPGTPVLPLRPAGPGKPGDPKFPVAPGGPGCPGNPGPAGPVQPIWPIWPLDPVNPTPPGRPKQHTVTARMFHHRIHRNC